jgi:hypothetical protein
MIRPDKDYRTTMETDTKHLLDSLIKAMTDDIEMLETQIALCRRRQPKEVFHLETVQRKYLETREFTVKVLKDIEQNLPR